MDIKNLMLAAAVFLCNQSNCQRLLANLKPGTWKESVNWLYNQVPGEADDVVLMNDILVDADAVCRSITTNGYHVQVLPGFHLNITGVTPSSIPTSDTLLSEITMLYSGEGNGQPSAGQKLYTYIYDTINRVTQFVDYGGFTPATTYFFYEGSQRWPYKTIFVDPCRWQEAGACVKAYDTSYYKYNSLGIVETQLAKFSDYLKLPLFRADSFATKGDSIVRYRKANTYSTWYDEQGEHISETLVDDTAYFYQQNIKGNIVYQLDSTVTTLSEHVIKHDKRPNPLWHTSIHMPVLPLEHFFLNQPTAPNNILENKENLTMLPDQFKWRMEEKIAYQYNANGWPIGLVYINVVDNVCAVLQYHYKQ